MKSGFTLIELLVSLAILTVFLSFTLPKVYRSLTQVTDTDVSKLNKLLNKACEKAQETGLAQVLTGLKGDIFIELGDERIKLSNDVSDVRVNDKLQEGMSYEFRVYPQCIADKVEISLSNEKILVLEPIKLTFKLRYES